ncbi:hypothetical protein [Amedibacterium intestinale]|jgi:hypothetical protein|uniref:Uncharacterized protein n=1 Tax=Amedibacterium intestinale TaxID=2583452 RepID=A0A6N4TPH1_9FIRM|nr:hypothetical protein [Amedibacterium intestinale]RHO20525.1 hypothetical protein DW220_09560 [Eubacterium sp. AM18-26]RHO24080.1 hypothetical protein DW212_09775 [Eubacterium sp. AM18-10LB-B]BBK23912.1 hypothetical protein Aargi30884_28150 [Amedibacterium intestinale]
MKILKKYRIMILTFVLFFSLLSAGFYSISKSNISQQKESLEKALKRGILQCYALEGRYPDTLHHLLNDYGIVYNKNLFEVKYEAIASNIMPNVTVLEKK